MAANQSEETISESLMESLRRLAYVVGRHECQRALLVDAAQGDDAGHHGKDENREDGKRHQAAEWIVSPVSRSPTDDQPGELGIDRGEVNGKAVKSRIGRTHKAPQHAKGDEAS